MLEINITHLLESDTDFSEFSASVAERGANAGPETWANAKTSAAAAPLVPADRLEDARDYFGEFGTWDDEERAAWSADDINALVLQYISGDIREAQALCPGDGIGDIDWAEHEALSEAGTIGGNMGLGVEPGTVWFSLSH